MNASAARATLRIENVSVRYGKAIAVGSVTESVAAGQWLGLLGPNGAGKSSLLRALAHLIPYRGLVEVEGEPLSRVSRRRRAQLVAYVPQQPELPAGMSVLDYTLLGRTPHIGQFGVESSDDRSLCRQLLEQLGLASFAERQLSTLSGGEVQRIVLARALAQQAPVLLLDEPTSALDLGRRVDALELVDELRREHGLTVVSAMHDLTLATQFSDRLALLAGGGIVASGTASEVLDESLLSECFGAAVRVLTDPEGGVLVVPRRSPRAPDTRTTPWLSTSL